jgi:hypothetical protein
MSKLTMLVAMLALVAVVAVPAAFAQGFDDDHFGDFDGRFAHFFDEDFFNRFDDNGFFDKFDDQNAVPVQQSFEQETDETGDVNLSLGIGNSGDNSNQCVAPMQFGNTGNLQNQQGFVQSGSEADDVEFSGSQFVFAPEQAVQCDQSVEQAAAASSW